MNFKINLIFLIKLFFLYDQKVETKFKYPENKNSFFEKCSRTLCRENGRFSPKKLKNEGLNIIIESWVKIASFPDVTLNLTNGSQSTYKKDSTETYYKHVVSNHIPSTIAVTCRLCNTFFWNRQHSHAFFNRSRYSFHYGRMMIWFYLFVV